MLLFSRHKKEIWPPYRKIKGIAIPHTNQPGIGPAEAVAYADHYARLSGVKWRSGIVYEK